MTRVIGIIGGIASGKSAIAEELRKLGAEVIHADRLGHQVLREPEVCRQLRARWGSSVFAADGTVDRKAVARIVFAPAPDGPDELQFLEAVTHPRIGELVQRRIAEIAATRPDAIVVLDAPILLEAGWSRLCNKLVFVDVDRPERLRRARHRGWTEEQFTAREAAQFSLVEKRKVADEVIDNAGPFDHTLARIQHFWHSLSSLPPE